MTKVICVRLPDDKVWSDFQAYVALKTGHVKGNLGAEVANALREYLENRRAEGARTRIKAGSKTLRNMQEITSRIVKETEKEIPQTVVERIITETVGGDTRTLRRYIMSLNDYGVLKPVRRMLTLEERGPKFIFEVNLDEAKKLVGLHL
jgi:hypothetical protein